MKILFDYQILMLQKFGGISRYYHELNQRIKSQGNEVYIPILKSQNYYFRDYIKPSKKIHQRIDTLINDVSTLYVLIRERFNGKGIDIIHPTYFYPSYIKFLPKKNRRKQKMIITVHDLICELFYPDVDKDVVKRRKIILDADGIIAISEHTKKDLLKVYPELDEKKIKVIYHGCSMNVPQCSENEYTFPDKYILFVGNRTLYKNGMGMLKAFDKIAQKCPDVHMFFAGGGAFNDEERDFIKRNGLDAKVIQKNISDDELYYAYKNALCFVFPSLYEGFGIPILEAFFCGCPVALSNASCFPEIAEDAAVYFDGEDAESMAENIINLITNEEQRQDYIERGKQRLKLFTWDKTAEETVKFYKEILELE